MNCQDADGVRAKKSMKVCRYFFPVGWLKLVKIPLFHEEKSGTGKSDDCYWIMTVTWVTITGD